MLKKINKMVNYDTLNFTYSMVNVENTSRKSVQKKIKKGCLLQFVHLQLQHISKIDTHTYSLMIQVYG